MPRGYVVVTREEMDKFMRRSWRAMRPKPEQEGNQELSYTLRLGENVGIKVLTSISFRDVGRSVGQDAIRVYLISLKTDSGLVGKAKSQSMGNVRVHRTQNWRTNLKKRIELLVETYYEDSEYWEARALVKKENQNAPTDKQLAYAMRLVNQVPVGVGADWSKTQVVVKRPTEDSLRQMHKKDVGKLIDFLVEKLEGKRGPSQPTSDQPSPKQWQYLGNLMGRVSDSDWKEFFEDRFGGRPNRNSRLTRRQVSDLIDALIKQGFGQSRYAGEVEIFAPTELELYGQVPQPS